MLMEMSIPPVTKGDKLQRQDSFRWGGKTNLKVLVLYMIAAIVAGLRCASRRSPHNETGAATCTSTKLARSAS